MSRVLESLEVMLDVYRQKCVTQSAEIERLKQVMEESLIQAVRVPEKTPVPSTKGAPFAAPVAPISNPTASQMYLDEIAEELESVLEKNERLERGMARLQRRLDAEEAWRAAVVEFMEVDKRIHESAGFDRYPSMRGLADNKSKMGARVPPASSSGPRLPECSCWR